MFGRSTDEIFQQLPGVTKLDFERNTNVVKYSKKTEISAENRKLQE
jgi:hypothetical protein